MSIPRIGRSDIPLMAASPPVESTRRQVAHVLTVLGWDQDGPVYRLECRAPARDFDKACVLFDFCHCNTDLAGEPCRTSPTGEHELNAGRLAMPIPGCWLAACEDLDEGVRALEPKRGIYLVDFTTDKDDPWVPILNILATIFDINLMLNASGSVSAVPTTASRYPGFGPEADLRDLIENALCEGDSLEWDDDAAVMRVDASEAAEKVWAWFNATPSGILTAQSLPVAVVRTVFAQGEVL